MRIVSGGIVHETNTFASRSTTLEDFVQLSGGDPNFPASLIPGRYRNTGTVHGGILASADNEGVVIEPLLVAEAVPGGIVIQNDYELLKTLLLERLEKASTADGLILDLHGAMVTEAHQDAEADLLGSVRKLVGAKLPIVVVLDLHANISPRMAELATCIIGFDTYPHVDMFDRGMESATVMCQILRGQCRPTMAYRQLPLITMVPIQCTLRPPMSEMISALHELEKDPRVITATLSMGFPFSDIPDAGASVIVVTDDNQTLAEELASEFANMLWQQRDAFQTKLSPLDEVIDYIETKAEGLVILADGSDNPGGGAPGNGTVLLSELVERNFHGAVVAPLWDAEVARIAHEAGEGASIEVQLGGKTDQLHGPPFEAKAQVLRLSDGQFVYDGPMYSGAQGNFGPSAVLGINGVEVLVVSQRQQLFDVQMLRSIGIEPTAKRLLVAKSAVHFRAAYGPLADRIFDADTPGVCRPDFDCYTYHSLRRPIFPLDASIALENFRDV